MEKENKIVSRVIGTLISEECNKLNKCSKRINVLNHQLEHYSTMLKIYREDVKTDMFTLMNENGWKDWAKEIKAELKNEEK